MANSITLQDAMNVVKLFDGEGITVQQFFASIDEAKNLIPNVPQTTFTKLIKTRIKGEAKKTISGNEINTIDQLKTILRRTYLKKRNSLLLFGDLAETFQKGYESVLNYANRIKEIAEEILDNHRLEYPNATRAAFRDFEEKVQETTISCFKRGLNPEIYSHLKDNKQGQTLMEVILEASDIEGDIDMRMEIRNDQDIHAEYFDVPRNNCDTFICKRVENPPEACQLCGQADHQAKTCKIYLQDLENRPICQLCLQVDHDAKNCTNYSLGIDTTLEKGSGNEKAALAMNGQ